MNTLIEQYTVDIYECHQYGKCADRRGPGDVMVCAKCRLFHDISDNSKQEWPRRGLGNWRHIPGRREMLPELELKAQKQDGRKCQHILPVIGQEPCKVCNNEIRMVDVYGCAVHGTCTLLRKGLSHQACNKCSQYTLMAAGD